MAVKRPRSGSFLLGQDGGFPNPLILTRRGGACKSGLLPDKISRNQNHELARENRRRYRQQPWHSRAIAVRLAKDGALVAVNYQKNAEAAAEVVQEIGDEAFAVQGLKFVLWLMVMIALWLTLWARQLPKGIDGR